MSKLKENKNKILFLGILYLPIFGFSLIYKETKQMLESLIPTILEVEKKGGVKVPKL